MSKGENLKKIIALSILGCAVFASDPITLDSLFKNQEGLRSITTLQSVSSGSSDSFASYPDLVAMNEGRSWQDVKSLSLTQTFLYALTSNFDLLASVTASAKRRESMSMQAATATVIPMTLIRFGLAARTLLRV